MSGIFFYLALAAILVTAAVLAVGIGGFGSKHREGPDGAVKPQLSPMRRGDPLRILDGAFTGAAIVLEPGETFETGGKRASPLAAYARRVLAQKGLVGRTIVMSFLLQLLAMLLPLAMAIVVDQIVPHDDRSLLRVLAAGIILVSVYAFFTSYVRAHLLLTLRTHLDLQMTTGFLRHLLRLPFGFFQLRQTGDLVMRLNSNSTIRELLTAGVMSGFLDGMLVAGYLLVILWTDLRIGAVVIAIGALKAAAFLAPKS